MKSNNLIWYKQTVPYYITEAVWFEDAATVTIQPGSVIKFAAGQYLNIGYSSNGTLVAEGTATESITFTSSATSPAPGA